MKKTTTTTLHFVANYQIIALVKAIKTGLCLYMLNSNAMLSSTT